MSKIEKVGDSRQNGAVKNRSHFKNPKAGPNCIHYQTKY
jgi:hypothetical protein